MRDFFKQIEKNFLSLAIFGALMALLYPQVFLWIKPHIKLLLGIIMFGMGITLHFSDFRGLWNKKKVVLAGVLFQYLMMPLLAIGVSHLFLLPKEIVVGMVLVGACPGGTASNVICYLAKANVALSVMMTFISTLLSPLLTPAIIYFFLKESIEVPFQKMFLSVLCIVALPVLSGLIVRAFLGQRFKRVTTIFPSISIICIILVISCIMALNQSVILSFPIAIIAAVILHNGVGLSLGYWGSRLFKFSKVDSRTLAIEVGMQNSGLAVALATQFFSSLSALPGAVFSLWHNLSGIILAKIWSSNKINNKQMLGIDSEQ